MKLPRLSHPLPGLPAALLAACALALAGCTSPVALTDPVNDGPFYQPHNFVGEQALPAALRRVVLLPVHTSDPALAETAQTLDTVLLASLQKQSRFEVVVLAREDNRRWFGEEAFASTSALPHGYLDRIAARTGADALLFVDLTSYHPCRPLGMGFRAKLALAADSRIIWAFDEVLSTEDTGVTNAARRHELRTDRHGPPVDLSLAVLQSPGRFAAFVAESMFGTLPPR